MQHFRSSQPTDGSEPLAEQLAYWRRALADLAILELPTDTPRGAEQAAVPAVWSGALPADLVARLRTFGRERGTRTFAVLLGAYQVLLHRYTGQIDIAVLSTTIPADGHGETAGRSLRGIPQILRTSCAGHPRVSDLIARADEAIRGASRQTVSLEQLHHAGVVEQRSVPRYRFDLSGPDGSGPGGDGHGRVLAPADGEGGDELWLNVHESPTGMTVSLRYDAQLFRQATIERLAGHLETILGAVATGADPRISRLPLLTTSERTRILVEWNDTRVSFPDDRCLHELVDARAAAIPDEPAVIAGHQVLTYGDLDRSANRLAHYLRSLGLGPGQIAGICVERSPLAVTGILGILKAGAAYLPLDPSYPDERLALMLADARASLLLTQEALVPRVGQYAGVARVVDVERTDAPQIHGQPDTPLPGGATPHHLAYVIYTSGSSGRPKGVLLDHRGRVNNFSDFNRRFSIGPGDRLLAVSSLGFDMSAYDLCGTLAAGAAIVLPAPSDERDPSQWADLMVRHRVTIWHSAPALLGMLLDHIGGRPELWPAALRLVLLGGDWIPVDLPDRLRRLVPDVEIISLGGATEVSMDSTIFSIASTDPAWRTIPYGRPMANQIAHVLEHQTLEPLPVGVPGELLLGGVGLAHGYLGNPALTAEKFVPDPFGTSPGARLYRTGDLARYRPDGTLELLGRLDQQVKIRGNRVELGEVAAALRTHPVVEAVAVVAAGERADRKSLIAYVVPALDVLATMNADHVEQWRTVYDETYGGESDQTDPTFNLIGWNSSYTGLPIPDDEMAEWVEATVGRIRELAPQRVLEIGCGTGLILFRVAPACTAYCGTDISDVGLRSIERQLASARPPVPHVTLLGRPADDLTGFDAHAFDTVILNSVTQLFPSIEYLLDVLERIAGLVRPGGNIFLGDVRSLRHLEVLHTSIQLFQAPDSLPAAQLGARIRKSMAQEEQLVIAPEFFAALRRRVPAIADVRVQLRRGSYQNELTKFRYDVIIEIGGGSEGSGGGSVPDQYPVLDWHTDALTLAGLDRYLAEVAPDALLVRGVPNARLITDVAVLERLRASDPPPTVADLRRDLEKTSVQAGVDPEDIWALPAGREYDIRVDWAGDGRLDAVDVTCVRREPARRVQPDVLSGARPAPVGQAWTSYANRPILGKAAQLLPPRLRAFLQERLPDYMVPSAFVVLDELPLSPNGKVNVRALRPPDATRPPLVEPYAAPVNPVEQVIARTWAELLGFEQVGRHDHFLELGGHSLLATQVASRLRDVFGLALPLRSVLSSPTVAALAGVVQREGAESGVDVFETARLRLR